MNTSNALTTYYFIIASSEFLLTDEPLEEIFRERKQHYRRLGKTLDFWFVSSPKFIKSQQLNKLRIKLSEVNLAQHNCSSVISTNERFITWLKLRFNNVAIGSFIAPSEDIQNPLDSNRN
uniref:hypothetical protein n=1 Tax=Analipus japonicus TaxID=31333 RepID=UPI002E768455|nr:hypothetical protein V2471_pgp044 [Analipus japonicus]WAM61953.1 hypothetical protein [Analipus japonicus]